MTTTAPSWKCPRCGTVAFAGQRFCRQCGHRHETVEADGDGVGAGGDSRDDGRPTLRPVSRLLIIVIIVLFAVLGGLAALLLNDIRGEASDIPASSPPNSLLMASPAVTEPGR